MAKKLSNSQFVLTQKTIEFLNVMELTPISKLVLVCLTTFYNPKHKDLFPSERTVANRLGVSERSVVRAIKELTEQSICEKSRIPYHSNRYIFSEKFFNLVHFIDLKQPRNLNIDYELWREAIYKKFEGICQLCGTHKGIMHAHHKKEYANNPEKRYDISNGILLCEKCHTKLHPWMKEN